MWVSTGISGEVDTGRHPSFMGTHQLGGRKWGLQPFTGPLPQPLLCPVKEHKPLPTRFFRLTHSGDSNPQGLSSCLCSAPPETPTLPTAAFISERHLDIGKLDPTSLSQKWKVSCSSATHTASPTKFPNFQPPPQKQGTHPPPNIWGNHKG